MYNSEECISVRKIIEDWLLCAKLKAYRYTTGVRQCCRLSFSQQGTPMIWDTILGGGDRGWIKYKNI